MQHEEPAGWTKDACLLEVTLTITMQAEDGNAKVRQGLPRAGFGSVSVQIIISLSNRPVELLRSVLSVSRNHEAVAQEGTQVPVQSSIFLAPKEKMKTSIRKRNLLLPLHVTGGCLGGSTYYKEMQAEQKNSSQAIAWEHTDVMWCSIQELTSSTSLLLESKVMLKSTLRISMARSVSCRGKGGRSPSSVATS